MSSTLGKRKARSAPAVPTNFTGWRHTGTAAIRVFKSSGSPANDDEKKAYLLHHGITRTARASKTAKTANGSNASSEREATALGFKNLKHAQACIKKVQEMVAVLPGLRHVAHAGKLFTAALRNALSHFSDSSVRQGHSGSILETTSFAVAAIEKSVKVVYFEDWHKDISKIFRQPRTFILKSEFSLDNTIKSKETDPELQAVWRNIVGLAALNTNNPNMRTWKENPASQYKGFKDVEPDVLEWNPPSTTHPNGTIRIYELKVGEGKPEQVPAEAYQLVKAKRAIELTLLDKGIPPDKLPQFELYFLPWMFGTPESKKPKFTNYKNFHPHGKAVWSVLSRKDKSGYDITELSRKSFSGKTGLSAELITLTLEMMRDDEANHLLKILHHIKRHSLVYAGTSENNVRALQGAVARPDEAPPKQRGVFRRLGNMARRVWPGKRRVAAVPGANNLATWMAQGAKTSSGTATNMFTRSIRRMSSRPASRYNLFNKRTGQKLPPVHEENNYLSNAESESVRNDKEFARIQAALARPEILTWNSSSIPSHLEIRQKNKPNLVLAHYAKLKPALINTSLPLVALYAKLRADHLPANVKMAFDRLAASRTRNEHNNLVLLHRPKNL